MEFNSSINDSKKKLYNFINYVSIIRSHKQYVIKLELTILNSY